MTLLSRTWPALLVVTASLALAQTPPTLPAVGVTATTTDSQRGETALTLDVGFGIRAVPASHVTVPSGEALRVSAPKLGDGISYVWTKNGRALPGVTGNVLTIPHVVADDAGSYVCLFSTPTTLPQPSQTLVLGVGPTDRLINLSTRGTVAGGGGSSLVSGLVIGASGTGKKLIIRAVGPSLSLFGVSNPLRAPVLRIFDAAGRPYENGYVYPPVVGGPTYESDLAESLARTGAFPLPAGTRDVVMMLPFTAGSYTVQVTSGDATGGEVLLEIYEVP